MFRILLLALLSYGIFVLLKAVFGFWFFSPQGQKRKERLEGEMVQDPVCETYIPKAGAIERKIKGELIYFCSSGCAEAYDKKTRAAVR